MDESFRLVYGDLELVLPLPSDPVEREQLLHRIRFATFSEAVQFEIAKRLLMALESSILPPSTKQAKYAIAIARELNVELPPEVLALREAASVFIGANAPRFRERRGSGVVRSVATEKRQPIGPLPSPENFDF